MVDVIPVKSRNYRDRTKANNANKALAARVIDEVTDGRYEDALIVLKALIKLEGLM